MNRTKMIFTKENEFNTRFFVHLGEIICVFQIFVVLLYAKLPYCAHTRTRKYNRKPAPALLQRGSLPPAPP